MEKACSSSLHRPTNINKSAPIAQRIEQARPKGEMCVRFILGAQAMTDENNGMQVPCLPAGSDSYWGDKKQDYLPKPKKPLVLYVNVLCV